MVVEYIRYQIAADLRAAFEAAYAAASLHLQASSHCLAYELAQCAEDPSQYILRIVWDSADGHLQGFRHSPEFMPFLAAIKPYINQILEMRHYMATEISWNRVGVPA